MCPIVYEGFNEVSLIIWKKREGTGCQLLGSPLYNPIWSSFSSPLPPPQLPCVGSCFQQSLLGLGETGRSGDLQELRGPAAAVSPWSFINKWPFVVAVVAQMSGEQILIR